MHNSSSQPGHTPAVSQNNTSTDSPEGRPRWFRGQLHSHSFWSDGRGFPEEAAIMYREEGYHFLSLTEHNIFADQPDRWRKIEPTEGTWPPHVSQRAVDAYVKKVGKENVELKTEGEATFVRLKTFQELQASHQEPGAFILLPGVEITHQHNKRHVHMNYLNVPSNLPSLDGQPMVKSTTGPMTQSELARSYVGQVQQVAQARGVRHVFGLNHPFWRFYDVLPEVLIDNPDIRIVEVCYPGMTSPESEEVPDYTREKFWDIANAFRVVRGQPLVFGTGVEDQHFYDQTRRDSCVVGWVMVRAKHLTADDLMEAIDQGDFYASTGVTLQDVTFNPQNRTLRVQVQAKPGVKYRIQFVTTKRDFDQTATQKTIAAKGDAPERTVMLYSKDIGRAVKTVEGTEAEYQLAQDDLYVRATIESDESNPVKKSCYPLWQSAWTQPYTASSATPE